MRTLAISPELRPQSMLSMSQELGKLSGATPTEEQPIAITDRVPRNKTPYVAAGARGGGGVVGADVVRGRSRDRAAGDAGARQQQPIAGAPRRVDEARGRRERSRPRDAAADRADDLPADVDSFRAADADPQPADAT